MKRHRGKRKPYVPPIPDERLDAMISALRKHAIATASKPLGPISSTMAVDIYWTIVGMRYGRPPPTRGDPANVRATAIVRDMVDMFDCPIDEAILAAFPNPNGVDLSSLKRNYYKLLKVAGRAPFSGPSDIPATSQAYLTTDHSRKNGHHEDADT